MSLSAVSKISESSEDNTYSNGKGAEVGLSAMGVVDGPASWREGAQLLVKGEL